MPPGELHFSEMKQGKNGFGRKEGWEARKDGGRNCSGHVLHERRIKKFKKGAKFTHLVLFGSDILETNFQDSKPINL